MQCSRFVATFAAVVSSRSVAGSLWIVESPDARDRTKSFTSLLVRNRESREYFDVQLATDSACAMRARTWRPRGTYRWNTTFGRTNVAVINGGVSCSTDGGSSGPTKGRRNFGWGDRMSARPTTFSFNFESFDSRGEFFAQFKIVRWSQLSGASNPPTRLVGPNACWDLSEETVVSVYQQCPRVNPQIHEINKKLSFVIAFY